MFTTSRRWKSVKSMTNWCTRCSSNSKLKEALTVPTTFSSELHAVSTIKNTIPKNLSKNNQNIMNSREVLNPKLNCESK